MSVLLVALLCLDRPSCLLTVRPPREHTRKLLLHTRLLVFIRRLDRTGLASDLLVVLGWIACQLHVPYHRSTQLSMTEGDKPISC